MDTVIIGYTLGETALAAMGAAAAIYDLLIGFAFGIGNGLAIVTARSYGCGDQEKLKKSVAASIVIGVVVTVAITVLTRFILYPFLEVLNTPAEIIDQAYTYISTITLIIAVMFAYNLCAGILRAIGNSLMPLVFLIISSLLNIVLDLVFIIRLHMGIQGAAVATVLAQLVSVILCLIYIYNKAKMIRDMTAQSPVIIVDYLQQMTSATNPDTVKSIIIEQNIAGLKQISKDFETAVIVISSLSRADALEPISQQSFAHTSAIEYTADVCLGLALELIYSEKFTTTKSLADKRLLVKEAIAENPRLIRLSIVKNRLGVASKDILMNYIPSNNAYLECPSYMNNFTEVEYTGIPKEFKETNSESNINNAEQTELKLL